MGRQRGAKRGSKAWLTCSNCGKVISIGDVRDGRDPCPNCVGRFETREADTDSALACRLEEYREKTLPVTDFYERRGILGSVDAYRGVVPVFKDVNRVIIE
jgi:adenylate kinase